MYLQIIQGRLTLRMIHNRGEFLEKLELDNSCSWSTFDFI